MDILEKNMKAATSDKNLPGVWLPKERRSVGAFELERLLDNDEINARSYSISTVRDLVKLVSALLIERGGSFGSDAALRMALDDNLAKINSLQDEINSLRTHVEGAGDEGAGDEGDGAPCTHQRCEIGDTYLCQLMDVWQNIMIIPSCGKLVLLDGDTKVQEWLIGPTTCLGEIAATLVDHSRKSVAEGADGGDQGDEGDDSTAVEDEVAYTAPAGAEVCAECGEVH